jgi:hypothetical protein
MAESGGQPGNQNATKGAEWRQALKRALSHKSGKTYREGLDEVAVKVVDAACSGDVPAWREIADRMDGKPAQSVSVDATVDQKSSVQVTFPDDSK